MTRRRFSCQTTLNKTKILEVGIKNANLASGNPGSE